MEIALRQMDFWYRTPLGSALFLAEKVALQQCMAAYGGSGRYLLQLGGSSEQSLFVSNNAPHKVRLSPEFASVYRGPSVQAHCHALPFAANSIDSVVLPHLLEIDKKPLKILEQVYSVLAPAGYLFILGFNPYSLWGLKKKWMAPRALPWRSNFYSAGCVGEWMKQVGFTILTQQTFFFLPPFSGKVLENKRLFWEAMGRLLWPACGAVYLMVAQKSAYPLEPIGQYEHCQRPMIFPV